MGRGIRCPRRLAGGAGALASGRPRPRRAASLGAFSPSEPGPGSPPAGRADGQGMCVPSKGGATTLWPGRKASKKSCSSGDTGGNPARGKRQDPGELVERKPRARSSFGPARTPSGRRHRRLKSAGPRVPPPFNRRLPRAEGTWRSRSLQTTTSNPLRVGTAAAADRTCSREFAAKQARHSAASPPWHDDFHLRPRGAGRGIPRGAFSRRNGCRVRARKLWPPLNVIARKKVQAAYGPRRSSRTSRRLTGSAGNQRPALPSSSDAEFFGFKRIPGVRQQPHLRRRAFAGAKTWATRPLGRVFGELVLGGGSYGPRKTGLRAGGPRRVQGGSRVLQPGRPLKYSRHVPRSAYNAWSRAASRTKPALCARCNDWPGGQPGSAVIRIRRVTGKSQS